jgi:hypothetical protein
MNKQDSQERNQQQAQLEDLTVITDIAAEVKGAEGSGHYTQMVWAPSRIR